MRLCRSDCTGPGIRRRRHGRGFVYLDADGERVDDQEVLPKLRARVRAGLAGPADSREQILACAVRLLDVGLFRIGTEDYAVENETYGLATMLLTS